MKYAIIMLSLIAALTGCASSTAPNSHPLDSRWTRHKGSDVILAQHNQAHSEHNTVRHYHVFNAPAQLASLNGFAETSVQQREAELTKLCTQRSEQVGDSDNIHYEYFWGSHDDHPLLSAFTINPATDCPATATLATASHRH